MSGHSKWANIKHKKMASDAKKGQIFSKIAKEIMITVRGGGADPASNITLRQLIQKARQSNMPVENVERAIKRGTGELEGEALEEASYEAFGAGGVQLVIQVLTNNRNRTSADVRHTLGKHGGNIATQGSVLRSFKRKGQILIESDKVAEDKLMDLALEAGAEDMQNEDGVYDIIAEPNQFMTVVEAINKAGIPMIESEIKMLPDSYMPISNKDQAKQLLALVDALEELDDVQNVYSNFDIEDSVLAEITK